MSVSNTTIEGSRHVCVAESRLKGITPDMRRISGLVLAGLSAMFVVSALWRPSDQPVINLCPFRALTGYPCPGCGMTRAFCALSHGEFLRAVHFNALSPLLYVALIVVWTAALATVFNMPRARQALFRLRPTASVSVAILAGVLVWWVVRLWYGL